jgi:hypothetical protein
MQDGFPALASDFWHRLCTARGQIVMADGRRTDRARGTGHRVPISLRVTGYRLRISLCFVGHAGKSELLWFGAAADPEQAIEVDTDGCGGLGVERVGHVDPGADAIVLCQTRDEGEGERCPTRAFGTGEFGDGPDGKSAAECVVKGGDAGGRGWADDTRGRGERGGDAVGKGGFDLEAEQVSGGHGRNIFALYSPIGRPTTRGDIHRPEIRDQ